tara:strand:+ start:2494 stop:2928 length:435 start_codon:yes stop_codon:yes gene_type:complete
MTHQLQELFDKDGKHISPQLNENVKNYLIDIDGTITEDVPNEEPERMITCKPWLEAQKIINEWYEEGHIITFFTSRTEDTREVTKTWLDKHNFKYHGLLMNKPRGGNYHWIDNHIVRATRLKTKWTQLVKKNSIIEVFDNDLEK